MKRNRGILLIVIVGAVASVQSVRASEPEPFDPLVKGVYLTSYLQELKATLTQRNVKLGMFVNPRSPRKPMVWATLPHEYWTLGNIEMDIDTWIRDGIVDELCVLGNSAQSAQTDTLDDLLWLARCRHL